MKYAFLSIILLFVNIIGVAAQSNCKKFRTGKFQNIENGISNCDIERKDSIQIEKYGKQIIKLKVEWIDECTYRLIFLEGNDEWWVARDKNRSTPDLIVRITETKENGYLQEAKFVNDSVFKYKSKIVKIE